MTAQRKRSGARAAEITLRTSRDLLAEIDACWRAECYACRTDFILDVLRFHMKGTPPKTRARLDPDQATRLAVLLDQNRRRCEDLIRNAPLGDRGKRAAEDVVRTLRLAVRDLMTLMGGR